MIEQNQYLRMYEINKAEPKLKPMNKTIIAIVVLTVVMMSFSSCGTKANAKKITKTYCKCMDSAKGIKEKAKCMTTATSEYTKVLKDVPASELEDFKKGYQEGIKACK